MLKAVKVQNHTRMKAYKVLERPLLNYGNEAWTFRKAGRTASYIPEMKFLRKRAGYSLLDYKINELIIKEPKIKPTAEYLQRYGRNWLPHINRMERPRLQRQVLHYVPTEDGQEMAMDRNRPLGLLQEMKTMIMVLCSSIIFLKFLYLRVCCAVFDSGHLAYCNTEI